jgi:hypothetical protein
MPAPEQLDLFVHSPDLMLRNDVIHALEQRAPVAARRALQALAQAFPGDAALASLDCLTGVLETPHPEPLQSHREVAAARQALEQDITRCAREALGPGAPTWLRPLWAALAERGTKLPFQADQAQHHSAALWLQGGYWTEAALAVEGIASWRRIPAPLAWMAQALCQQDRLDDAWPLLAELAWMAPLALHELLSRLDDPLLRRLRKAFDANFEGTSTPTDLAWFPAWLLVHRSALAARLGLAQRGQHTGPEQGLRLLLELLGLERQGRHHELTAMRSKLRDLHPALYAQYMATR